MRELFHRQPGDSFHFQSSPQPNRWHRAVQAVLQNLHEPAQHERSHARDPPEAGQERHVHLPALRPLVQDEILLEPPHQELSPAAGEEEGEALEAEVEDRRR